MQIAIQNQKQTMTSREIAELVEARHDSVKRTVETLADKGVIDIPQSVGYLDEVGRGGQVEYVIGKRDTYVVVAQLSPEFTGRLVDRWMELESNETQRLAADLKQAQTQLTMSKEALIEQLRPEAMKRAQKTLMKYATKRVNEDVKAVQHFLANKNYDEAELALANIEFSLKHVFTLFELAQGSPQE